MLSFKPTFSLSSFTFIKRLFSSSSLSAIRVVSSAYLRLLFHSLRDSKYTLGHLKLSHSSVMLSSVFFSLSVFYFVSIIMSLNSLFSSALCNMLLIVSTHVLYIFQPTHCSSHLTKFVLDLCLYHL